MKHRAASSADREQEQTESASDVVRERVASIDWEPLDCDLDARGNAVIERLLTPSQCSAMAALYSDEAKFRGRVVMERHGFGRGEYKYFRYPLPELVLSRGARRVAFLGGDDALVTLKGDVSYKELWVRDLKTGRERQLTALGRGFTIADFDISADGRELLFDRSRDESDIVLIERPK